MIEALRRLVCSYLCKPEEEAHPFTILRHRSGQHIRLVLHRQYPNARIRIADADYSAPTLQEFNRWIREDTVSERRYQAEHHDCDDFAHAIQCQIFQIGHRLETTITMAYCEGYAQDGYHAFNLLIDTQDNIFIVEPQSDVVVPADESAYLPDFIQL